MPVCVAARIAALLDGLTPAQLDLLVPAERRRFAELCRRWHELAEKPAASPAPKAGILHDLWDGHRPE
jgi:hypothetical protein